MTSGRPWSGVQHRLRTCGAARRTVLHGPAPVAGQSLVGVSRGSVHDRKRPAVPFKHHAERRFHDPKPGYRITNRAEYDAALRQRGSPEGAIGLFRQRAERARPPGARLVRLVGLVALGLRDQGIARRLGRLPKVCIHLGDALGQGRDLAGLGLDLSRLGLHQRNQISLDSLSRVSRVIGRLNRARQPLSRTDLRSLLP